MGQKPHAIFYEIAHIPLVIAYPAFAAQAGQRRKALTQTTDLMPTLLDLHGIKPPATVEGHSLMSLLKEDMPLREAAIYGIFGAATNITDGRYAYFRYPQDMTRQDLYEYTLMLMHLKTMFAVADLAQAELARGFNFTQGVPLLKVPARRNSKG